jgi:hypothetical protein
MWYEYIGVDERKKHITQWDTMCHSDRIARMGGRPWDVLIYSLEFDSLSAAICRVSSSWSQSSRVVGNRLAVDKLLATTPAFRARYAETGATICCGRLAWGGSRGAYGTYIGPGTSWTTGATGAGTGAAGLLDYHPPSWFLNHDLSLLSRQFPFNYSSNASFFYCWTFELSTQLAIATAWHVDGPNA